MEILVTSISFQAILCTKEKNQIGQATVIVLKRDSPPLNHF